MDWLIDSLFVFSSVRTLSSPLRHFRRRVVIAPLTGLRLISASGLPPIHSAVAGVESLGGGSSSSLAVPVVADGALSAVLTSRSLPGLSFIAARCVALTVPTKFCRSEI